MGSTKQGGETTPVQRRSPLAGFKSRSKLRRGRESEASMPTRPNQNPESAGMRWGGQTVPFIRRERGAKTGYDPGRKLTYKKRKVRRGFHITSDSVLSPEEKKKSRYLKGVMAALQCRKRCATSATEDLTKNLG